MSLKTILSLSLLLPIVVSCGNGFKSKRPVVGNAASVAKMSEALIIDAVSKDALNVKGYVRGKINTSVDGNWFTMDPVKNNYEGVSADYAYNELGLRSDNEPVIVAVIDSGVDIEHEDLQGRIWINEGEIANNGIDDDNNGFIDDVNGWNFIGGKDGRHVDGDTLEVTREYVRYKARIDAGETLTQAELAYYDKVKDDVEGNRAYANRVLGIYRPMFINAESYKKVLTEKLGLTEFTYATLKAIRSSDQDIVKAKEGLLGIIAQVELDRLTKIYEYYNSQLMYFYNINYDSRIIVGDDQSDLNDHDYGNNDVEGPDASHGTHVSGIIGALRYNNLGARGVADNVRIMVLRAVPNGDERDKDVANAVRYAVDNGAKIINMSFGKSYSPYKEHVDAAFQYAADHNVLIVHAAGNSNENIDVAANFPNRFTGKDSTVLENNGEIGNWLEIGASTAIKGLNLPADFSNYGKIAVNLFAPGHDILSTVPGSKYDTYSGTSMACPVVSGVAALVLSQYPSLSASELRELLIETVRLYDGLNVFQPGGQFKVPFRDLSVTGGVVNAYHALVLAEKIYGKREARLAEKSSKKVFFKKK